MSVAGEHRRAVLGVLTDAVMGYWLAGTHDPDLREWWQSEDAVDTCTELIHAELEALEEVGYRIVRVDQVADLTYSVLRRWSHESLTRVAAMSDALAEALARRALLGDDRGETP